MTEKMAAGPDGYRPDQRSSGIEQNKLFERYGARSNDKGRNRSQPVKKPKRQDHRCLKSVHHLVNFFRFRLPGRSPGQNRLTVFASQIKKELITAKTAHKSSQNHPGQYQIPLMDCRPASTKMVSPSKNVPIKIAAYP